MSRSCQGRVATDLCDSDEWILSFRGGWGKHDSPPFLGPSALGGIGIFAGPSALGGVMFEYSDTSAFASTKCVTGLPIDPWQIIIDWTCNWVTYINDQNQKLMFLYEIKIQEYFKDI